jgi:hypothetical protein
VILAQDAQVTDARPSFASTLPNAGLLPHKGKPLFPNSWICSRPVARPVFLICPVSFA